MDDRATDPRRLRTALIHIAEYPDAPPAIRIMAMDAVAPPDDDGRRWCGCGDGLKPDEARCWICRSLDEED
jgi:hypothetical protein